MNRHHYTHKAPTTPHIVTILHLDGIELCVAGEYSAPDELCDWGGNFEIERVFLDADPDTNLAEILHPNITERIIEQVMKEQEES